MSRKKISVLVGAAIVALGLWSANPALIAQGAAVFSTVAEE